MSAKSIWCTKSASDNGICALVPDFSQISGWPYLRAQAKLEVHIETTICLGRVLFISGIVNCLEPTNDNQLPLHSMVPTDPTLCQKCSIAGHDHLLEYLPEEGRTSGFSFPQLLVLLFSQLFVLFATDRHGFAFLPECSLTCSTLWLCSPRKRTFGTIIDTGHTYPGVK